MLFVTKQNKNMLYVIRVKITYSVGYTRRKNVRLLCLSPYRNTCQVKCENSLRQQFDRQRTLEQDNVNLWKHVFLKGSFVG